MYRDTIFQYVKKQYGTIPEYLWNDLPDSAILRNDNGKWYAVFMNLEGFKIGLDTKDRVDIMVVKCKPDMISVMTHMKGFLPGYYMDKSNWMTNSSATADFMIHSTLMNEQYSHQIENFKNTVDVRVKEMQ